MKKFCLERKVSKLGYKKNNEEFLFKILKKLLVSESEFSIFFKRIL